MSKSCPETWLQDDLLLNTLEASPTDKINRSDCIKKPSKSLPSQAQVNAFFPSNDKEDKRTMASFENDLPTK